MQNPLPSVLNNKFDAVPPTEGMLFDFAFDFKGRGQWKHWGDAVKNADVTLLVDGDQPFVPTVDSVRFAQLQSLSRRRQRPFLLLGPSGCGKTVIVSSHLKSSASSGTNENASLTYTALRDSEAAEFTDILLKRLHKRRQLTYGPPLGEGGGQRGTLFLDDLHVPEPESAGRVNLHEVGTY